MAFDEALVAAHRELREATVALDSELYRMMSEGLTAPSHAYLEAAERFREAERRYGVVRRERWGI